MLSAVNINKEKALEGTWRQMKVGSSPGSHSEFEGADLSYLIQDTWAGTQSRGGAWVPLPTPTKRM